MNVAAGGYGLRDNQDGNVPAYGYGLSFVSEPPTITTSATVAMGPLLDATLGGPRTLLGATIGGRVLLDATSDTEAQLDGDVGSDSVLDGDPKLN